ncbi:MAG: histidinol phosphate phosphatase domain-containing protein [Planctomycetota bacterium]
MYDLHTHTYYSDGVLGYSELARRCEVLGYDGLVIADHCDAANLLDVVRRIAAYCERREKKNYAVDLLPGCELTHVPPGEMAELTTLAREEGAEVVLAHGETLVEPVEPGTNRAAIEAGVDVLAHPGLISKESAQLAADEEVLLEISGRKGHSLTNGHVARRARQAGAGLSFGSDGHAPGDYPDPGMMRRILRGAGLHEDDIDGVEANNRSFFVC